MSRLLCAGCWEGVLVLPPLSLSLSLSVCVGNSLSFSAPVASLQMDVTDHLKEAMTEGFSGDLTE